LGHPIDDSAVFNAHYRAMDSFARRRLAGEWVDWRVWQADFFTRLGLSEPERGAVLTNDGFGYWTKAVDGAIAAVTDLAGTGIRLGVVSNSDGSVRDSLSEAGFGGLFELVVDSYEVGFAKPDPAIFAYALENMGVEAGNAWYVGDSLYHDVGGGQAAEMAAVVLVDPLDLAREHTPRVASVAELGELSQGETAYGYRSPVWPRQPLAGTM
jgi:FMN phosphatase YigB (HAD superfamily)